MNPPASCQTRQHVAAQSQTRLLRTMHLGDGAPRHKYTDSPAAAAKAPGIFGVPLRQSITYANVAISLVDDDGKSYIYGYVPIVVAKCGVFLKEKGSFITKTIGFFAHDG